MIKNYIKAKIDAVFHAYAKRSDIDNLYKQITALIEIKEIVGPQLLLGPLRSWSISPDALLEFFRDLTARVSPTILEFGSGESTVAIAAALRHGGSGKVVSFEHDKKRVQRLNARLEALKLAKYAKVEALELCEYGEKYGFPRFSSYKMGGEADEFDLALIDGPPLYLGEATRSIPLSCCVARLAEGRVIYLDDADRENERVLLTHLAAEHRDLVVEFIETEKGMARLSSHRAA